MKTTKYFLIANPFLKKHLLGNKFHFKHALGLNSKYNPIKIKTLKTNTEHLKNLKYNFSYLIKKNIIYRESKIGKIIFKLFWNPKLHKTFIFLFTILLLSISLIYYNTEIKKEIDKFVKGIIITKIIRNKYIINKISYEILFLVRRESIKRLMSDLIVKDVLPNREIRSDLYRIIKRELLAYIKSEECRKELKILIVKDVMRNEEVRNELFELIKSFILLKEVNFLEDKLEKILVDILCIEAIHSHVAKKIENEVHKALKDEEMIKLAVKVLSEKFGD